MFVALNVIGRRFGMSAREVGRLLKAADLRDDDGLPTIKAVERNWVERSVVRSAPWRTQWLWDLEAVTALFEKAKLKRVDVPSARVGPPPAWGWVD